MTVGELKVFIDRKFKHVDLQFRQIGEEFGNVKYRLDEIEEAIHDLGSGKPCIEVRFGLFGNGNRKGKQKELDWLDNSSSSSLLGSFLGTFFASLLDD